MNEYRILKLETGRAPPFSSKMQDCGPRYLKVFPLLAASSLSGFYFQLHLIKASTLAGFSFLGTATGRSFRACCYAIL